MENELGSLLENVRYVVLGLFDGVLTSLGIVIASYYSGAVIEYAIKAGLAGGIAVSLSNGFGAFFAEEAEMGKRLRLIEKDMFRELKGTRVYRRYRRSVRLSLITHSMSTFGGAVLLLTVFLITKSVYVTTGTMFLVLFLLGCYIGKWGYSHFLFSGFKLVAIGSFIFLISLLLGSF